MCWAAHVLALEALIAEPEQDYLLNCGYGRGFSVLEVLDVVGWGYEAQDFAQDGRAPGR